MFGFLKRKKEPQDQLGTEHAVHTSYMDFELVVGQFEGLTDRAKATLLYRLVEVMPYKVAMTLLNYLKGRLYGNSDDSRQGKGNPPGGKKSPTAGRAELVHADAR